MGHWAHRMEVRWVLVCPPEGKHNPPQKALPPPPYYLIKSISYHTDMRVVNLPPGGCYG